MNKQTFRHTTRKSIPEIRAIVRELYKNASIENIPLTALDDPVDIAVYIDARPALFGGRGIVDIRATDQGSFRLVDVSALATTFSDNTAMGFDKDMSDYRKMSVSKKMAHHIIASL